MKIRKNTYLITYHKIYFIFSSISVSYKIEVNEYFTIFDRHLQYIAWLKLDVVVVTS